MVEMKVAQQDRSYLSQRNTRLGELLGSSVADIHQVDVVSVNQRVGRLRARRAGNRSAVRSERDPVALRLLCGDVLRLRHARQQEEQRQWYRSFSCVSRETFSSPPIVRHSPSSIYSVT